MCPQSVPFLHFPLLTRQQVVLVYLQLENIFSEPVHFTQAAAATQFLAANTLHLSPASLFLFSQSPSRPWTYILHVESK